MDHPSGEDKAPLRFATVTIRGKNRFSHDPARVLGGPHRPWEALNFRTKMRTWGDVGAVRPLQLGRLVMHNCAFTSTNAAGSSRRAVL